MRKYELSISADYVPEWGITEAVREFFQNAIDEEVKDAGNKMFFRYDKETQVMQIGNKHSELEISTLLFGSTTKRENQEMIGNHGEGYKIATVVLLRLGKKVVFRNYCRKELWRPRLVKSRRYGGVLVPTFFVEQMPMWKESPEHNLIIEIEGITQEEYQEIEKANLHLQKVERAKETSYGSILEGGKYVGKVYVGGLFICVESGLEVGLDFKPRTVRLERDRSMVNSFDIKWYAARMIEELNDANMMKRSLRSYTGTYITAYRVPDDIKNEIAEEFIHQYGEKAVPVSNQEDMEWIRKRGYKPIIVSESMKDVIIESKHYKDIKQGLEQKKEKERPLYERFCEFVKRIENHLNTDEVAMVYEFADEIESLSKEE